MYPLELAQYFEFGEWLFSDKLAHEAQRCGLTRFSVFASLTLPECFVVAFTIVTLISLKL